MVRFEPNVPRRYLFGQLMLFLAWVGATGFAILLHPSLAGHGTHTQLGLPPCPSMLILHRPCPGCGMTTSWTALVHGEIGYAFHCHWLGPISYLLLAGFGLVSGWAYLKGIRIDTATRGFTWFSVIFTVTFIVYGAIRFALG
ncbi:MAG: DUF2752 domain-containing protein [Fimbriimonadales bacterium]